MFTLTAVACSGEPNSESSSPPEAPAEAQSAETADPVSSDQEPGIGDTGLTTSDMFDPATALSVDEFRTVLEQGDDAAIWYVYAKGTDGFASHSLADYQGLAKHSRTVIGALDIWTEVGNGGLAQYFFNGYFERWPVQREALVALGQDSIVASTDEAFDRLQDLGVDLADPDASLDDLIGAYETGQFDQYDNAFFPAGEDPIYDALRSYIDTNLEALHAEISS